MRNMDKREKIMEVSLKLFAEHGFHRVSMDMIAGKADVAVGTIYIYFAGKDELIEELFLELENKIISALQKTRPAKRSIRNDFLSLMNNFIKYLIDHPLYFRYMEQYINSPFGIALRRDKFLGGQDKQDMLSHIFQDGIDKKLLKDLPVGALFSLTIAPLIFLLRDHILGFITLDKALINKITEACWDGIKR